MPLRTLKKRDYPAKKYRGISELYRKSDGAVTGYYISYEDELGSIKKVRVDIINEPGTRKAVDEVARIKSQRIIDRDEKTAKIATHGRVSVAKDETTLDELMDLYFKSVSNRRDEKAVKKDKSIYRRFVQETIGTLKIKRLDSKHFDFIREDMSEQDYAERTIVNVLILLQSAFNFADKQRLETLRPFRDIDVKQPPHEDVRLLSDDEVEIIFKKAKELHPSLYFHVKLLYHTAQRPKSIMELTAGDIDFEKGQIYIKSIKKQKNNYIPISKKIRSLLEERVKGLEPKDLLEPLSYHYLSELSRAVFIELNEKLYMTKALKKRNDPIEIAIAKDKAFKKERNKWVSRYSFRHTAATKLYNSTGDVYLTQSILNHSDPKMTMRYAQQDKGRQLEALDGL